MSLAQNQSRWGVCLGKPWVQHGWASRFGKAGWGVFLGWQGVKLPVRSLFPGLYPIPNYSIHGVYKRSNTTGWAHVRLYTQY